MARSWKLNGGNNTTARSNKSDKVHAHRKLRREVAHLLQIGAFDEAVDLRLRDVSNIWSFAGDGKRRPDMELVRK